RPSDAGGRMAYYLQQNIYLDNPNRFSEARHDDWLRTLRETNRFKTVDNLMPKPDFTDMQLKLMAVNYLNYWTDYVRKREAAFPGAPTLMPAEMEEIRDKVSLADEM